MGIFRASLNVVIILLICLLIFSTLTFPFFRNIYEEGFGTNTQDDSTNLNNEWCVGKGSLTTCTGCNATSGSGLESFQSTCHSLVDRQNNTDCYSCTDFGPKNTIRGLILMIFSFGLLGLAVLFLKGRAK